MNPDLGVTNTWLAVIAVTSLVQLAGVIVAAVFGYRLYLRVQSTLERFEREASPLLARARTTLDEASDVLQRLRRADDEVRHALGSAKTGVSTVVSVAGRRLLPAIGIWRSARAAWQALRRGRPTGASRPA